MNKLTFKGYKKFFKDMKKEIQKRRYKTLQTVNRELIGLYWEIGKRIVEKQENSGWGDAIVENLARDLSIAFPDTKGFSERNLWNMKNLYLSYKTNSKLQTLSAEISWSNNILIIEQLENIQEREFYLKMSIRERWSFRELRKQIDTDLFSRYMNVKYSYKTLPSKVKDKLEPFKDHYILDFLGLNKVYSEEEMRKAVLTNLREFFLEFGKNFAFIGEEYPIRIGDEIYRVDLLFYHRELHCLVPIELKIGKFKPEYIGKMQFYLAAIDKYIKLHDESPSIGLILCKSKNDETVKLAISQAARKMGIATYQTMLPETKLIEQKLHNIKFQIDDLKY